jgi:iron complex outermembrane receptor protein
MRKIILFGLIIFFHINLFAQGTIKGKVIDKTTKEPLPFADVHLIELKRGTITKNDGTFIINKVPAGNYTIEVSYVGYKKTQKKINLKDDETVELNIELEQTAISLPGVVVTGTMYERSAFEIHQPIAVLDEDKLGLRLSDNIAKTLSYEPGINLEFNGSNVGRPVIRGLTGTRILILENGVRIGDASDLSPDHAISFEPTSVERIEVIRGPASLFYGTNSVGGAINIISEDIPKTVHDKLRGSMRLIGSSVNSSLSGSGAFDYGIKNFGFRGEFGYRKNGDTKTPIGTLNNTESENLTSSIGIAYHAKNLTTGFAFRNYQGNYGVPTEDEEHPRFKINRNKFAFKSELGFENSKIQGIELQINQTDYDHRELENGEIATHIKTRTLTSDLKLKHAKIGNLSGMLGSSFMYQNYSTTGEEKFFADANLYLASLILYEELELNRLTIQTGVRYDFARIKSKEFENAPSQVKNFSVFSTSAGFVYKLADPMNLTLSFSRGFRIPSLQELFAYGPHLGTLSFEVGNPDLKAEISNEVDLSFRWLTQRSNVDVSLFLNYINNFVYPYNTGEVDSVSGLPIYGYTSSNSVLRGFEAKFEFEPIRHLNTSILVDYVEAKKRDVDEYLPFIPPLRGIIGIEYRTSKYNFGAEIKLVSSQNKVAPDETRTPGYGIINLHFGLRFPFARFAHEINLNIENLTNKTYYDHLSRIKSFAPMPGRNVSLIYHLLF